MTKDQQLRFYKRLAFFSVGFSIAMLAGILFGG